MTLRPPSSSRTHPPFPYTTRFRAAHEQPLISTPAMCVRLIAFNRPATRNALTLQMQATLDEVLAAFEGDQDVGAIVLCGVGDKAFSAGYDIHEMQHFDEAALDAAQQRRDRKSTRLNSSH